MFAGHIGAALAIGRAERRVNIGVFITAALLLDILLWALVMLGWESVVIPPDFAVTHQPHFVFPWTHGLLASLVWALIFGGLVWRFFCEDLPVRRTVALLGAAVFSHWVLDALVHRPELPIASTGGVGLGLWDHMPWALGLEAAIVLLGLSLFLSGGPLPRGRSIALASLVLLTLVFTVMGMTKAPAPPSASAMAGSSLITLGLVCVFAGWAGRPSKS